MSKNVAIAPSFLAWSFDFSSTMRSPLQSLVTSMVSSPWVDFNSLWILKGDLSATFADPFELITINFLNRDQFAKGDMLIKLQGSPPTMEPNVALLHSGLCRTHRRLFLPLRPGASSQARGSTRGEIAASPVMLTVPLFALCGASWRVLRSAHQLRVRTDTAALMVGSREALPCECKARGRSVGQEKKQSNESKHRCGQGNDHQGCMHMHIRFPDAEEKLNAHRVEIGARPSFHFYY
ncbi:hypothetical protein PoB_001438400 [Plakobranchus ocellatus]|uniref:Uncharacterized protein n=1 Tax=Plakobranchus ocellatus TaxID=259542 RepID=A0AAV3Z1F4_9GAST|nr:hypothetical protein PoB_001438400 [Plakobranchus ocellatus]